MTSDEMEVPDEARDAPRWRRARLVAASIALVFLVALLALWTQRKPIASTYIDKALAARGVPARYRIGDLGLGRQRLTQVVIGDPAHPDLIADWIELNTDLGLSGIGVAAVRAGHVQINARLVDGKLSLGTLDRLMPAPSGKPFALPSVTADIADARMRLVTPQGVIGLKLVGKGRLDDGFRGTIAAVSDRLDLGGCVTTRVGAALAIRIDSARPALHGPVQLAALSCGAATLASAGATVSVALNEALDHWDGKADLLVKAIRHPSAQLRALSGTVAFAGSAAQTDGTLDLRSGPFAGGGTAGAALSLAGRYRVAGGATRFDGRVGARQVAASPSLRARLAAYRTVGAGTPIGPIVTRLAGATAAAARSFDLDAAVGAGLAKGEGHVTATQLSLAAASGARATVNGALGYAWPGSGARIDGTIAIGGGDMPAATIRVAQAASGAPLTGTATVRPYAAGNARLALTPIAFTATPGGLTRVATRVTLSGPLGDGRIDNLSLPVIALWDGHDRLQVNRDCAPLAFDRLAVSGLALKPARLVLCPVDGALVRLERGRLGGGAQLGVTALSGQLGSSPIALTTASANLRLAAAAFTLTGLGIRIGTPDRLTRLDFATLDGAVQGGALAGRFGGGAGQIANVPLLLSAAAGDWALRGGRLGLTGAMQVADAAADPRFKPLAAQQVALSLADGIITTTGRLVEPAKGSTIADVSIVHDLGHGSGHADLAVSGIVFGDKLQPEQLTRLTFGVIADVKGTVTGEGHIAWSAQGVTSTGKFRTAGTDLAAAFGPVTGIAGEVRFTDLLALETAPGQVATVRTINPGIAVNDGTIRYQLLAGTRIKVEEGRWPFARGALLLEPTLLNFGESMERRMTFRVTGMDAGEFLQQFDFKNLDATGVFDGTLPMVFDEKGGRIENGHLIVREGGGTVAYVGEISQKDVGFWGNFAFQALKSLRYHNLDIVMNGPLAGEMVTQVRFAGVGQGKGARRNFLLDRLQKLPLVFNVRITAPFRGLIDSAQSFYDPKRLIQRNLPALMEEQRKRGRPPTPTPAPTPSPTPAPTPPAIQPPESRKMP